MPNKKQKQYENTLDEENESSLGDIPYNQKDSYINEKK